jgi:hypothetical protein
MSPPDKNVGAVKDLVGKTVLRLVKCRGAYFKVVANAEYLTYRFLDTVRVDRFYAVVVSLVSEFVPDGNSDLFIHNKTTFRGRAPVEYK